MWDWMGEWMGEWMDTPQTVTTTRAPAVLKNAHWSNLQKKFNQTRFRLVEERGSSTFNGKVSTEF